MSQGFDQPKQESFNSVRGFPVIPAGLTGERENTKGHEMSKTNDVAATALRRFHNCIERVSWLMVRTFEPNIEYEDAKAEASILVCVYVGLMTGRHSGKLPKMEAAAEHDEARVQAIMQEQLRLDLSERFGRQIAKQVYGLPITLVPENDLARDDAVGEIVSRMANNTEMRERYPYLCKRFLEDRHQKDIAEAEGVPIRTIEDRVRVEKKSARNDPEVLDLIAYNWAGFATPAYSSEKSKDEEPTATQIWVRNSTGHCVECGTALGTQRVRNTCSLDCWNYSAKRRTKIERSRWDFMFGYRRTKSDKPIETEDPRGEFPELYAYEGWASWNADQEDW